MGRGSGLWWRLRRSPFARPGAGVIAGPALVAVTLSIDAHTTIAEQGMFVVTSGNAGSYLAALLGGSFTVAAMVFWVRGMLVQLAAGGLPARVVRPHLDDAFLQNTLALILATFGYAAVLILGLPPDPAQPAPFVAVSGALLLGMAALMAVVVTIVNSVRTTDESSMLRSLTNDAITAVQRRFPEVGSARADEPNDPGGHEGTIGAPATGWVDDIDEAALLAAVPSGCHLRVYARSGTFVAEGGTLATLCGTDVDRVRPAIHAAFSIGPHRDPTADVEYATGRLNDVAMEQLGAEGRTGGHEALMHMALVLRALSTRAEQEPVVRDGDRSLEWANRLSREDLVEQMFSSLHHSGKVSSGVAVTLLRGLGMAQRALRDDDPLREALHTQTRRILDGLPRGWSAAGPVNPLNVALEEQLVSQRDLAAARE